LKCWNCLGLSVDGVTNLDNTDIDGTLNTSGVITAQTSANISQVAITSSSNAVAWDAAAAANAYHVTTENTKTTVNDNLSVTGDLAVDGTANLDNTDIDGTLVVDGSNTKFRQYLYCLGWLFRQPLNHQLQINYR
jgi:cytoskeletal protein CcmA (bactofilin family)